MMKRRHSWHKYFYEPLSLDKTGDKRTTGLIRDDNKVYMKICYPAHYFQKYKGFGISEKILEDLKNRNVEEIKIIYFKPDNKRDKKDTYRVSLAVWLKEGIPHVNENNPKDKQIILPLSKMRNDKEYQTKWYQYQ